MTIPAFLDRVPSLDAFGSSSLIGSVLVGEGVKAAGHEHRRLGLDSRADQHYASIIREVKAKEKVQKKSCFMITTNRGFADWTQVFGDQTMTAAMLDRLTYKARIINCT